MAVYLIITGSQQLLLHLPLLYLTPLLPLHTTLVRNTSQHPLHPTPHTAIIQVMQWITLGRPLRPLLNPTCSMTHANIVRSHTMLSNNFIGKITDTLLPLSL